MISYFEERPHVLVVFFLFITAGILLGGAKGWVCGVGIFVALFTIGFVLVPAIETRARDDHTHWIRRKV